MSTVTPDLKVSYGELCDFYNKYHIVAATMDRVKIDTEVLEAEVSRLKVANSHLNNYVQRTSDRLEYAKTLIIEAFDNDTFDRDVVRHIAESLDIDLIKEYDVEITVTFNGTVSVPLDFNIDDLDSFINVEASVDYRDGIESGGFDVNNMSIDATIAN
jgi:hypothetical protein